MTDDGGTGFVPQSPARACLAQVHAPTAHWPHDCGPDADARVAEDPVTNAIVFNTGQDPLHLPGFPFSQFYDQIFAVRPDGHGLRQLTDASGSATNPDGGIRVEFPGPFAYSAALH